MRMPLSLAAAFSAGLSAFASMSVETGESAPERFAAKELTEWIGKLSESAPDIDFRLGVRHAADFPDDAKELGSTDGYAVRRRGRTVFIFANVPRGVLYGVYDFLERNSDLIFARANLEYGAVYSSGSFCLRETDFLERPVYAGRGWWICWTHWDPGTEYWNARMRCNDNCAELRFNGVLERSKECGFEIDPGGGHNMHLFMPTNYFASNPECFPFRDGARRIDVGGEKGCQLCFTCPETAEICGRELVKYVDGLKAKGIPLTKFSFKHEDNQRLCMCERCLADIVLPDGRHIGRDAPGFRSTQVYMFKNRCAEIFRQSHPDVRLTTYAYQFTAPPPAVKVDDQFDILFCPYPKNDKYSILDPENAKWKKRVDDWARQGTTNLVWREYYGCGANFPRPLADVTAKDLRYLKEKLGIARVTAEYSPDIAPKWKPHLDHPWDMSAMEYWVISHLYWNPYADVEKLRDYYLTRTYRKASKPMARFFRIIREAWYRDPRPSYYNDSAVVNARRYIFLTGLERQCRGALVEAENASEGDVPQVGRMIRRTRARFEEWMKVASKSHEAMKVPLVKDAARGMSGDGAVWLKAARLDRFAAARSPGTPSSEKTVMQAMHDYESLYVRFCCADSKAGMLSAAPAAPVGSKEFWPYGDKVEFFFEGNLDNDRYYHLVVDVNGNRYDGIVTDGKPDLDWKSCVKRTGGGYVVTMVLPFKTFGIEPAQKGRYGMMVFRTIQHDGQKEEHSTLYGEPFHSPASFVDMSLELE